VGCCVSSLQEESFRQGWSGEQESKSMPGSMGVGSGGGLVVWMLGFRSLVFDGV
jgi:hypothetical protein